MANCLRHFSVQLKVPSSIFSWSSFSTRCPSQKYLLQKAKQLSFGVRFLTGAASLVASLGSWCFGLRAAILAGLVEDARALLATYGSWLPRMAWRCHSSLLM